MNYNQPWGWAPQKSAAPMGNSVAPLAASAASMPETVMLPEDPSQRALKSAGQAVGMKALDNMMKPGAASAGSVAQDSATKAALFSDAGYGAPMGAAAAEASTVGAEAVGEVATEAATEAAAETAASGLSSAVPYAGVLKSIAEGEYGQAAAQAAGTAVLGPLGGLAAKYAASAIGFANGTTNVGAERATGMPGRVPAVPTPDQRAAMRAAAGARFAPELFRSVNSPSFGGGNIGVQPPVAAGGKGGGATTSPAPRPGRPSVVAPVPAPPAAAPWQGGGRPGNPFNNPDVFVGGA